MAGPEVGVLLKPLHVISFPAVIESCDDSRDSSGLKGSIVLIWVGVDWDSYIPIICTVDNVCY